MKINYRIVRSLALGTAVAVALFSSCGKKKKHHGDDDDAPPPPTDPTVDPAPAPSPPAENLTSTEILAKCYQVDAKDVSPIVAADEASAKTQAQVICSQLNKVKFGDGVNAAAEAVAVE